MIFSIEHEIEKKNWTKDSLKRDGLKTNGWLSSNTYHVPSYFSSFICSFYIFLSKNICSTEYFSSWLLQYKKPWNVSALMSTTIDTSSSRFQQWLYIYTCIFWLHKYSRIIIIANVALSNSTRGIRHSFGRVYIIWWIKDSYFMSEIWQQWVA